MKFETITEFEHLPSWAGLADVKIGPNLSGQLIALVLNTATKEASLLVCSDVDPRLITSYISRLKNASYVITQKYRVSPSIINQIMAQEEAQAAEAGEEESTEAIRYLTKLISQAHALNSSDIRVTKRKYGAIVEMRVNGEMLKVDEVVREQAENMIRATYNALADAKQVSFNEAEIQDAKINLNTHGKTFNIRYAHAPIFPDGCHVSMRLLEHKQDDHILTLEQLGYTQGQIRAIDLIMSRPDGAVIIAGTTGSGKSTTLNSLLSAKALKDNFKSNILTVEDPPEYEIRGAKQSPVVRNRQDSESGRNRFAETIVSAMAFIDAVLTGHLGFSTIHASDACQAGIIGRTVCAQVVVPDYKLLDFLQQGKTFEAFRHWRVRVIRRPPRWNNGLWVTPRSMWQ